MGKRPESIAGLVKIWKLLHLVFSPLQLKIEEARHAVTAAIVAAGGEPAVTPYGTIPLHTKQCTDWKGMVHAELAAARIEELLPTYTKTSEPWVQAPHGWREEGVAAAAKAKAKR